MLTINRGALLSSGLSAPVCIMDLLVTAALTGIFAGIAAVTSTAAVERLGGALGGILSTVPFLILCNSIGLSARLAGMPLRAALFAVPPAFFASALYLLVWRYGPDRMPAEWGLNRKFAATIAASLLTWTTVAVAIMLLAGPKESRSVTAMNVMAYGAVLAQLALGLTICWSVGPAGGARKKTSPRTHALRAGAAFFIGAAAILLSRVSDTLSGVLVAFPVLFLITNVSVWTSVGPGAVAAASGPMILGSVAVPVYALVYALFMTREASTAAGEEQQLVDPSTGLPLPPPQPGLDSPLHRMNPFTAGFATFALAIVFVSLPGFLYLRWRRSVAAGKPPPPAVSAPPVAADSVAGTPGPADGGAAGSSLPPLVFPPVSVPPGAQAPAPVGGAAPTPALPPIGIAAAQFSHPQHETVLAHRLHERLVRKAMSADDGTGAADSRGITV